MANHLEGLTWEDVDGPEHAHVILTRHPDGVLPSYARIDAPTMLDLGYAHQRDIAARAAGRVHVVTAESLFEAPKATLKALCAALDMPWEEGMLTSPGGRPEDGIWAPYWYEGSTAVLGGRPALFGMEKCPRILAPLERILPRTLPCL